MNTKLKLILCLFGLTSLSFYLIRPNERDVNSNVFRLLGEKIFQKSENKARNLDEYKVIHQKIIDGKLPPKVAYAIFHMNGFSNRINSLLSAFVLAVLGNRALIVVNPTEMSNFYEEPFNNSFGVYNQENELNFNYKQNEIIHYEHLLPLRGQGFIRFKPIDIISMTTVLNDTDRRVGVWHIDAFYFYICTNPIYYDKLYNFGLVSRATIEDAKEKMNNKTKHLYTKDVRLESALLVGWEVAGTILNTYWRPTKRLQSAIDYYVERYFSKYYVIGFQVRTLYFQNFSIFVDCAQRIERALADTDDASEKDPARRARRKKPVKWMLTIDDKNLYDKYLAENPDRYIHVNGTIGHVGEWSDRNTLLDVYQKAILDNELLSRCDELVITGGSGYSFLAAMRAQRMPYTINFESTLCHRANLSYPPFSWWAPAF